MDGMGHVVRHESFGHRQNNAHTRENPYNPNAKLRDGGTLSPEDRLKDYAWNSDFWKDNEGNDYKSWLKTFTPDVPTLHVNIDTVKTNEKRNPDAHVFPWYDSNNRRRYNAYEKLAVRPFCQPLTRKQVWWIRYVLGYEFIVASLRITKHGNSFTYDTEGVTAAVAEDPERKIDIYDDGMGQTGQFRAVAMLTLEDPFDNNGKVLVVREVAKSVAGTVAGAEGVCVEAHA
jgi:hypothetical protein